MAGRSAYVHRRIRQGHCICRANVRHIRAYTDGSDGNRTDRQVHTLPQYILSACSTHQLSGRKRNKQSSMDDKLHRMHRNTALPDAYLLCVQGDNHNDKRMDSTHIFPWCDSSFVFFHGLLFIDQNDWRNDYRIACFGWSECLGSDRDYIYVGIVC